MHNNHRLKSLFVVFALCLFIFSPLLILLVPQFFPITFFYEKYTWVYYTPAINYLLCGIAIGLLFFACLVILLIKKYKIMIPIASVLTIGAIVLIVGSSVSYFKLTPDVWKCDIHLKVKSMYMLGLILRKLNITLFIMVQIGLPTFLGSKMALPLI